MDCGTWLFKLCVILGQAGKSTFPLFRKWNIATIIQMIYHRDVAGKSPHPAPPRCWCRSESTLAKWLHVICTNLVCVCVKCSTSGQIYIHFYISLFRGSFQFIHKPCGHGKGRGFVKCQKNVSLRVKMDYKGVGAGGVKIVQKTAVNSLLEWWNDADFTWHCNILTWFYFIAKSETWLLCFNSS